MPTHHTSVQISSILRHKRFEELKGYMKSKDGQELTVEEIEAELRKARAEGKRLIPLSPCDNFDYDKGCMGHEKSLPVHDVLWEENNG